MTIDQDGVISTPFVRTRYNYDMNAAGDESGLFCSDPTRAQQQFEEECNINTIVERFGITGQLPQNLQVPLQNEFTEIMDYQSALNKLIEADHAFSQMPAPVRERFGNDAGAFVAFCSDPANLEEARKLGIARPALVRVPQAPIEVVVIPTPPAPPSSPPGASNPPL